MEETNNTSTVPVAVVEDESFVSATSVVAGGDWGNITQEEEQELMESAENVEKENLANTTVAYNTRAGPSRIVLNNTTNTPDKTKSNSNSGNKLDATPNASKRGSRKNSGNCGKRQKTGSSITTDDNEIPQLVVSAPTPTTITTQATSTLQPTSQPTIVSALSRANTLNAATLNLTHHSTSLSSSAVTSAGVSLLSSSSNNTSIENNTCDNPIVVDAAPDAADLSSTIQHTNAITPSVEVMERVDFNKTVATLQCELGKVSACLEDAVKDRDKFGVYSKVLERKVTAHFDTIKECHAQYKLLREYANKEKDANTTLTREMAQLRMDLVTSMSSKALLADELSRTKAALQRLELAATNNATTNSTTPSTSTSASTVNETINRCDEHDCSDCGQRAASIVLSSLRSNNNNTSTNNTSNPTSTSNTGAIFTTHTGEVLRGGPNYRGNYRGRRFNSEYRGPWNFEAIAQEREAERNSGAGQQQQQNSGNGGQQTNNSQQQQPEQRANSDTANQQSSNFSGRNSGQNQGHNQSNNQTTNREQNAPNNTTNSGNNSTQQQQNNDHNQDSNTEGGWNTVRNNNFYSGSSYGRGMTGRGRGGRFNRGNYGGSNYSQNPTTQQSGQQQQNNNQQTQGSGNQDGERRTY